MRPPSPPGANTPLSSTHCAPPTDIQILRFHCPAPVYPLLLIVAQSGRQPPGQRPTRFQFTGAPATAPDPCRDRSSANGVIGQIEQSHGQLLVSAYWLLPETNVETLIGDLHSVSVVRSSLMQTIYFGKNRYPSPCPDCVVLNHVSS